MHSEQKCILQKNKDNNQDHIREKRTNELDKNKTEKKRRKQTRIDNCLPWHC
jgi:hypothetical protein